MSSIQIAVTALQDGPDYTGEVLIAIRGQFTDNLWSFTLPQHEAGALGSALLETVKRIEANSDPS